MTAPTNPPNTDSLRTKIDNILLPHLHDIKAGHAGKIVEQLEKLIAQECISERKANVDKYKSLCGCPMCEHHTEAFQLTEGGVE